MSISRFAASANFKSKEAVTLVGGDSAIGTAIAAELRARGLTVHCSTRRANIKAPSSFRLDFEDETTWQFPLARVAYIAAAMTRLSECRQNPAAARRINVDATVAVARRLIDAGAFVVFLSTNQVFDGMRPFPTVSAKPNPVSIYGELKAEAEERILALGDQVAVVRLTKVIGPHLALFQAWQTDLRSGRPVQAFHDLIMAPIAMGTAASTLINVGLHQAGGIWHIGSSNEISYTDAARQVADRLGASIELVVEISAAEAGIPAAERPLHASLDCSGLDRIQDSMPREASAEIDRGLSLTR